MYSSPMTKTKLTKYNQYKYVLTNLLVNERKITMRQFKLLNYLYMEEDIAILASFEIFLFNSNLIVI